SQRLTVPNGTAFQRTTADARPQVQLTLQGAGSPVLDEATVYFEAGASSDFEPAFDAEKLVNPTGLNLSTSLAGGRQLSIDGQPELGAGQRAVPLAVGVPAAGVYTITASQLLNLGAVPVYLRDQQLGTLTDLRQQATYQFTVSNSSAPTMTRFELVFSPQQALATVPAALAQQVALYPNPAKTQVTLALPTALGRQAGTAVLMDALGRVLNPPFLLSAMTTYCAYVVPLAQATFRRLRSDSTAALSLRVAAGWPTLACLLLVLLARVAHAQRPQLSLGLLPQGGTDADSATVYFQPGATVSFDIDFDASKLPNSTGLNLASITVDGQQLTTNGLPPSLLSGPLTVP
nr:hypothetical protein [Tanacetum cinerariifolium]